MADSNLSPGVETPEQMAERLVVLRRKLDARTGRGNATPLPRFKANVEQIRGEIVRLEGLVAGG